MAIYFYFLSSYCSRHEKSCTGKPCIPSTAPPPIFIPVVTEQNDGNLFCVSGWSSWLNRNKPIPHKSLGDVEELPTLAELVSTQLAWSFSSCGLLLLFCFFRARCTLNRDVQLRKYQISGVGTPKIMLTTRILASTSSAVLKRGLSAQAQMKLAPILKSAFTVNAKVSVLVRIDALHLREVCACATWWAKHLRECEACFGKYGCGLTNTRHVWSNLNYMSP